MRRSDESPPRRTGGIRKDELKPVPYTDPPERETRMTETDFQYYEDNTEPPRQSSTNIRRTNNTGQRITSQQGSPIPQRQRQAQPQQRANQPPRSSTTTSSSMHAAPAYPPITIQQTPRNNTRPQGQREQPPKNGLKGKVHWLLPLGVGMIAMLILWELGSIVLAWGIARYEDFQYGNPRTYQVNMVVGHGGDSAEHPSHFIAVNLNRQAIVVEFPAGNPAGAESYVVPYYILGSGADQVPVTLEFRDVTGDGKLDMIIHIHLQSQDQTFVFVNDGTKFRPPTSKDNIHL